MCFSATASFVTSGVLTAAGAAAVVKRRPTKREWLFAAIPFIFAVQQAIEGAQWLLLRRGQPSAVLGYAFLFFAFLLWPTYIPLAAAVMERNQRRRAVLWVFLGAGIAASVYLLLTLVYHPLAVTIVQRSVRYDTAVPFGGIGVFGYAIIVCGSLLIASDRHLRLFGALTAIAFSITYLFFEYAFTSVWCFFAAALSVCVALHFLRPHRSARRG